MLRRHAVNVRLLPQRVPLRQAFDLARAAGFSGLEALPEADPDLARSVADAAASTGLAISSVEIGDERGCARFNMTGEELESWVDLAHTGIRNAADWGAELVLVVPGFVTADCSAECSWRRATDVVGERLVPVARDHGVVIGLENTWYGFLLTAGEHARFVDQFDPSVVRAYFDPGNVVFGHPEHWIPTLGDRLAGVHYKDYAVRSRREMGAFRFLPVGSGDIDWDAVDLGLARSGYDGWLTQAGVPPPLSLWAVDRLHRKATDRSGVAATGLRRALEGPRRRRFGRRIDELGRRARERDAALAASGWADRSREPDGRSSATDAVDPTGTPG